MPKRVIDFDAMWGSDKLASCTEWAQAEYAWLYGLADASGCFELTNLRVIWGRVAAIRRNLTIERLEQVFGEFQDKGLLFVWEHEGKRYGHWTGSDVPGRLPPPSWRMRLERLAPPVPKQQLAEYVSRYARGRAGSPGGGFFAEPHQGEIERKFDASSVKEKGQSQGDLRSEISDFKRSGQGSFEHHGSRSAGLNETQSRIDLSAVKGEVEDDQAQDWDWNKNKNKKEGMEEKRCSPGHRATSGDPAPKETEGTHPSFSNSNLDSKPDSNAETARTGTDPTGDHNRVNRSGNPHSPDTNRGAHAASASAGAGYIARDKSILAARELIVGRGPVCGPVRLKPEALERIRRRNAGQEGSRSP